MEWFLFWVGVNFLIGYAIGKPKNQAVSSALICVVLGPIGWIIAALSKGNTRTCPFCAETVRAEAIVCKHCHKELPAAIRREPEHTQRPLSKGETIATILLFAAIISFFAWIGLRSPPQQNVVAKPPIASPSPPAAIGSYVSIRQRVRVNIPGGEVIIPVGYRVKLLSAQGSTVNVDYDGYSVPIPATALSK